MRTRKTNKITKLQLITELSDLTTITKVQCDFMFDTLMAIVKDHLLNEREVELKSLGKFYYLDKAPQVSNMTGGMIPAQKQLKFRVADRLARVIRVNSRED